MQNKSKNYYFLLPTWVLQEWIASYMLIGIFKSRNKNASHLLKHLWSLKCQICRIATFSPESLIMKIPFRHTSRSQWWYKASGFSENCFLMKNISRLHTARYTFFLIGFASTVIDLLRIISNHYNHTLLPPIFHEKKIINKMTSHHAKLFPTRIIVTVR